MSFNIFNDDFSTNNKDDIFQLSKQFNNEMKVSTPISGLEHDLAENKDVIEYFEYDIVGFLNYIINEDHCKDYKQTGDVIIQMIRFNIDGDISNQINGFEDSITNLIDLLSDKVKSYIINEEKKTNLLKRSYWLGVTNYLLFKMYKESDYNFFKYAPSSLEKIVDLIKFLMITTIDSINDQITDELIVNNLLYFYEDDSEFGTGFEPLKNELKYKDEKNWIWKHKKKNKLLLAASNTTMKRNSIEKELNIAHGLSPPPMEEQANSPIKICHILNSLKYVLTANNVSSIIQKQLIVFALTQIINKTFNNLIEDDFIKTRDRSIKIKLNLLMIQDWCKVEDNKFSINSELLSEIDDFILETYPQNLLPDDFRHLCNVYTFNEKSNFYYKNSLKVIFDVQAAKLHDMLEFLTIMSNFSDKEKHLDDFTKFVKDIRLNKQQILKLISGYRYEISEPSFRFKKLIEKEIIAPAGLDKDELHLPLTLFKNITKITIPFTKEMLTQYGNNLEKIDQFYRAELESIHDENLKKYGNPTKYTSDLRKPEIVLKSMSKDDQLDDEEYEESEVSEKAITKYNSRSHSSKNDEQLHSTLPAVSDFINENPW